MNVVLHTTRLNGVILRVLFQVGERGNKALVYVVAEAVA